MGRTGVDGHYGRLADAVEATLAEIDGLRRYDDRLRPYDEVALEMHADLLAALADDNEALRVLAWEARQSGEEAPGLIGGAAHLVLDLLAFVRGEAGVRSRARFTLPYLLHRLDGLLLALACAAQAAAEQAASW